MIGQADWSPLDGEVTPPNTLDELDVADVVSELEHDYESPAPRGGWAIANVLGGKFDGGRVIPAGEHESFATRASSKGASIVMRSDDTIDVLVRIGDASAALVASRLSFGWTIGASPPLPVSRGDRVVIVARSALRDFHVWVVSR